MPKLKVFRTTSGFHDSFVAVPSRAAALRAWGANTDLFAMGAAEQVTDAKLMTAPLAKPGTVIQRSRGSAGEHMSAAGPAKAKRKNPKEKPKRAANAKPPSRAKLDQADQLLAEAEMRYERARAELDEKTRMLNEKRRALQRKHEADIAKQRERRDRAAKAYREMIKAWQATSE